MSARTILCLHGFGVRGYFWEIMEPHLSEFYERVLTPDLRMDTIETVLESGRHLAAEAAREDGRAIAVLGHSLGGVVAALTARDLGSDVVERAVLLAPPFGEQAKVPGKLVRFLLEHKLIPDFVTRPQFFTNHTPTHIQKSMFKRAVDETPALQSLLFKKRRFHTDLFDAPLSVPSLVVASEADKIVPAAESKAFAERLGATLTVYDAPWNIGHDDLTCAPAVASELAERIRRFAQTNT